MAVYDTIKFDRDNFIKICIEEYDKIMYEVIKDYFEIIQFFDEIKVYTQFQGKEYYATFNDIRAWVIMFGRGREMDKDNPFLEEYKKTDLWARDRPDSGKIVYRGSDRSYDQYNYKTGELRHYAQGSEPQGEIVPNGIQKTLSNKPWINFKLLIRQIYKDFVARSYRATNRIEQRANEYFIIQRKVI